MAVLRLLSFDGDSEFAIDLALWKPLLLLARVSGWRPSGTVMPVHGPDPDDSAKTIIVEYDRHWRGDYDIAQGQMISGQDAQNLIGYLSIAVGDLEKLTAAAPGATAASLQLDQDDPRRFFVGTTELDTLRTFLDFGDGCAQGFSLLAQA